VINELWSGLCSYIDMIEICERNVFRSYKGIDSEGQLGYNKMFPEK